MPATAPPTETTLAHYETMTLIRRFEEEAERQYKAARIGGYCHPSSRQEAATVLLVPPSHRNAAGIDKKAVLLGMGGKFELWSEQAHLAQIRLTIAEDEVSEDMLDLRL